MKTLVVGVFVFFGCLWTTAPVEASVTDGTIDTTYRYAWGENVGWVDFGSTTDAVHITDSALTGSVYGENIGWIVLDPVGYGGVTNDSEGNLAGEAWGENIGWVDFSAVTIGADGYFTGAAYGENIGWITFSTTTENKVLTDWRPLLGSSTIANHDDTQVNNAFTFQNITNGALFAFKLTPESGTATVTDFTITISGAKNIDTSDFSNIRLFRDHDGDAAYDATDEAVGGSGTMSIVEGAGTISFTTDFLATTSEDYVLIADWEAQSNGSYVRLSLYSAGVALVGDSGRHAVSGLVSAIQHNRNNKGGGGAGSGGAAAIGGDAPAGHGVVSGGGDDGGEVVGDEEIPGEQIGDPVNYRWPTAQSGDWINGTYVYDRTNNTHATTSTEGALVSFLSYGFSIPGTNVITGIEVRLEVSASTGAGDIGVQLSWDGGTSWTATLTTDTLTTSDVVATLGGAADTWGRAWVPANFSNANFVVRLTGNPVANQVRVDGLVVRVYHQAGGGGAGGGGGGGAI